MQRRWMVRASAAVTLLGAVVVVGACQSIAGIHDRTLRPFSQQCVDFCNTVQKNCIDANKVYADNNTCLEICSALPPGTPGDATNADTVACRMLRAQAAESSPQESCAAAGPGGDGSCGTDCDAYCTLFQAICPDQAAVVSQCLDKCPAIADSKGFTAAQQKQDSVECRLAQLEKATADKSACIHAAFQVSGTTCKHTQGLPDCTDYCRAVMVACTGSLQQYKAADGLAAMDQCLAVCGDLPKGQWDDVGAQSIGCRYYHSFFALGDPSTHCPHAGPGGDGTCSDPDAANCESYCILLQKACQSDFDNKFTGASALADCEADCQNRKIAGSGNGKLFDQGDTPSTMMCCLRHLSEAATFRVNSQSASADSQCQLALGQCQDCG